MTTALQRLQTGLHREWDAATLGLGAVFATLFGIQLWTMVVTQTTLAISHRFGADPAPMLAMAAFPSLLGLGVGTLAYVRYRDLELGLSRPQDGTWPVALAVIVAPALLVVAVSAVGNVVFDVSVSAITQQWMSPQVSPEFFLRSGVLPEVFRGIGYALLACGVVYESVRDLLGADDAAGIAVLFVGFYWLLPRGAIDNLSLSVTDNILFVSTVIFGVAFGLGVGVLYRTLADRDSESPLKIWNIPVFVFAFLGIVAVALQVTTATPVVDELLWILVLGLAVVGYARTRSVWVAVLSVVTYLVAISAIVLVEASLGLAVV